VLETLPLNNVHWEWEELVDMAKQYGNKDVINNMNVFQKYIKNDKSRICKGSGHLLKKYRIKKVNSI